MTKQPLNFHQALIENCFTILDKKGSEVPWQLWDGQTRVLDTIVKNPTSTHIIVKAASVGMSSIALAFGMIELMTKDNQTMVLLTHEDRLSHLLLRRAKSFVRRLMESRQVDIKILREPADEIELNNGSLAYIGTAGSSSDIGRGNPINVLIGSEIAFYKDAGSLMRALIPRAKFGIKIFESTANGAGGWFYHRCKKAFAGSGGDIAQFIPWYVHPEYMAKGNVKLRDKNELEVDLQEEYNLTDAQLLWRRQMIDELDDDPKYGVPGDQAFRQEYPFTWEEAFLVSGNPVFGTKIIEIIKTSIMNPMYEGELM